jgi:hypothetical protein
MRVFDQDTVVEPCSDCAISTVRAVASFSELWYTISNRYTLTI